MNVSINTNNLIRIIEYVIEVATIFKRDNILIDNYDSLFNVTFSSWSIKHLAKIIEKLKKKEKSFNANDDMSC